MPDWSYRTFIRPTLLRLGEERARRFAVGALARLGRLPSGLWLIDFLGHMRAAEDLTTPAGGRLFPGPVGLGALVDPSGEALAALSRFGCGFVEVGPVAEVAAGTFSWKIDLGEETLRRTVSTCAAETVLGHLTPRGTIPVFVRLAPMPREAAVGWALRFARVATGLVVDQTAGGEEVALAVVEALRAAAPECLVLLGTTPEHALAAARVARTTGAIGVWLHAEIAAPDCLMHGRPARDAVRRILPDVRAALGPEAVLVAGGVLEPQDARTFLEAGATLVAVDEGLPLTGPGLIKRSHEALHTLRFVSTLPEPLSLEAARSSWFWLFALGTAMLLGGALAVVLSSTRVLLPYDEALCGMSRAQLVAVNPRLIPFMAHDRMSLAGTMLSIGIFYAAIAWHAVRCGRHWAKVAIVVSASTGLGTFFLFLGFGYFDPFHAFVTAINFQFLVLGLHAPLHRAGPLPAAEWRESAAWRRAQWGQLIFVLLGVGLMGAGAIIVVVGCSFIFVQTDLDFLRATAAQFLASSERLLPLIAHDRASLGGMLIANGLVIWLAAQWGMRAGERWLWWTFALAGNIAFSAGIGVHLAVAYLDWVHLAPALLGWSLWILALWLTREWLTRPPAEQK